MHEKTSPFRLMHLDPHDNMMSFLILFSISNIFIKTYTDIEDINIYIGKKKQMTET